MKFDAERNVKCLHATVKNVCRRAAELGMSYGEYSISKQYYKDLSEDYFNKHYEKKGCKKYA